VLLLQHAIKVAAARHAEHAAAATPAALKQQHQQQGQQPRQRKLRLRDFRCEAPAFAPMLYGLPAHSLEQLQLDCSKMLENPLRAHSSAAGDQRIADPTWPLAAELARLSNLRALCLDSSAGTSGSGLLGVAQLTRVTQLKLQGIWQGIGQPQHPLQQLLAQPLSLQELHLHVHEDSDEDQNEPLAMLDLAHQTKLQCFSMKGSCSAVLPPQLQQLEMERCRDAAAVLATLLPLQQLQRLTLGVDFLEQQPLLWLAQLPGLTHVGLQYDNE
jgi:hypothetical protein